MCICVRVLVSCVLVTINVSVSLQEMWIQYSCSVNSSVFFMCLDCLPTPELCREQIFSKSHFYFFLLLPSFIYFSPLSEALGKMKDVYEKNPQMGDAATLASQISQTSQNIERLKGEMSKYEVIPLPPLFIHNIQASIYNDNKITQNCLSLKSKGG